MAFPSLFHILLILTTASVTACQNPHPTPEPFPCTHPDKKEHVALFINAAPAHGPGLRVIVPTTFSASANDPNSFAVRVENLLDNDIFLEDDGADGVSSFLQCPGGGAGGGGGSHILSGYAYPYRMLYHGVVQHDGSRALDGDGIAVFHRSLGQRIKPNESGCKGAMTLTISGFFKGSNHYFLESIKVPIKVVP